LKNVYWLQECVFKEKAIYNKKGAVSD